MAVIDNRTDNLDLPLPHENNELQDDVFRLRECFEMIDGFIFGIQGFMSMFASGEIDDCDVVLGNGFWKTKTTTLSGPPGYAMAAGDCVIQAGDTQGYLSKSGRSWWRHKADGAFGPYIENWTSSNLIKQATPTDVTAGRMMAVGAFGIGTGSIDAGSTNANSLQLGSLFFYETTETAAASLNLPSLGGAGVTARHWNVFTQGTNQFRTQIATEVRGVGTTKGRMFRRTMSEGTWTTWSEIAELLAIQSQIDALVTKVNELESYAIAGL